MGLISRVSSRTYRYQQGIDKNASSRKKAENRQKRGPGRKAKRQQDPVIPKEALIADGVISVKKNKIRSRTAKRLKKLEKEKLLALSSDSQEDLKTIIKSDVNDNIEKISQETPSKIDIFEDEDDDSKVDEGEEDLNDDFNLESDDEIDQKIVEEMNLTKSDESEDESESE